MLSRIIVIGTAAALALSAPAMAKGPHGHANGHAGMSMGSVHGRGGDEWRANRQGPAHASASAHERANANAGLNDMDEDRFEAHQGYNYGRTHREVARAKHRQGPAHASAKARAKANANAGLNPQD